MPTDWFYRQAAFLKKYYRVASLSEAIDMLEAKRVEAPTVVLTFDDGYADNFVNLRAVANEVGIPVALFISTGHVTGQQPFPHDVQRQEHGFYPLNWEQVCFLKRNGFEIGSHTRSHFDCGSGDPAALGDEIIGSKMDLQEQLGMRIKFFSFPWGQTKNMSPLAIEIARTNYPYIFEASGGVNVPRVGVHPWFLKRSGHRDHFLELELSIQCLLGLSSIWKMLPGLVRQQPRG